MTYYVLGHIGTQPKLLGMTHGGDDGALKRHEAMQDGYDHVMVVTRGVIDMLQRQRRLIPNHA